MFIYIFTYCHSRICSDFIFICCQKHSNFKKVSLLFELSYIILSKIVLMQHWCNAEEESGGAREKKNGAKQNAWLHSNVSFEQKRSPAVSALKNKSWGKLINLDRQARLKKTSQDSSLLTTSKATDKPLKVRSRLRWCSLHFPLQMSR